MLVLLKSNKQRKIKKHFNKLGMKLPIYSPAAYEAFSSPDRIFSRTDKRKEILGLRLHTKVNVMNKKSLQKYLNIDNKFTFKYLYQ